MKNLKGINLPVMISSLLLISIGILVIYSSSKELAIQQLIFTVAGLAIFFLVSKFELEAIKNLTTPLYLFILLVLLVTLILGIETRGSFRWITIGILNIQPSEFAKPILILFLAKYWSERVPTWLNIFKSLLYCFPAVLLIFKQPDLGSALTLLAISFGMLFAVQISAKKMIILAAIVLLALPAGWFFLHGYQRERISSFLAPQSDPLGRGYNLIQSTIAVGSGQFLGRGLGRGTQSRLQFLPEFRTDFIFASIAEEMGFIGSLLILSLYLFLLLYSLEAAGRIHNLFSLLVIIGVVSMILFQVVVNIGMNVGLLPITGITLPLISYGGSSLVATMWSLGMLASSVRPGDYQSKEGEEQP